jgi:hypothetical protein
MVIVAAVKIYVAAVVHAGAQEKKMERQDETPFTTKIGGKNWFGSQFS